MAPDIQEHAVTISVDEKHSIEAIISVPLKRSTWTDFGVIITHGAGGDMNTPQIVQFANKFSTAGLTVLRFTCKPPNFAYRVRCYAAVVEFLKMHNQFGVRGCIVSGRSMGARVAAELATIGTHDGFVLGVLCLSYPLHRPRRQEELRISHVIHLRVPVLFISGARDLMCRTDLMEKVVDQIASDKKIHWVEDADHSLNVRGKCDLAALDRISQLALDWCQSVFTAER